MREIKFRGKRMDDTVHNGRWVYGHYFIAPLTDENSGMPAESGWFFLSGSALRHCIEQHGVVFTVDPESVGEYTGLRDKNGVEIYDGDILTSDQYPFQDDGNYNYHGIVEWIDEHAAFFLTKSLVNKNKRGISNGISEALMDYDMKDFEVIGNVYENPDLIAK